MGDKKDDIFNHISPHAIFTGEQDYKTILVRGKTKQVIITLQEKIDELRRILYTEAKQKKKNRRTTQTQEIIDVLSIDAKILEKYPKTNPYAQQIISKSLAQNVQKIS